MSEKIKYDIVVCGAGVAGIASAIAAARLGKRVALIVRLTSTTVLTMRLTPPKWHLRLPVLWLSRKL